jgi:hypothetical protein
VRRLTLVLGTIFVVSSASHATYAQTTEKPSQPASIEAQHPEWFKPKGGAYRPCPSSVTLRAHRLPWLPVSVRLSFLRLQANIAKLPKRRIFEDPGGGALGPHAPGPVRQSATGGWSRGRRRGTKKLRARRTLVSQMKSLSRGARALGSSRVYSGKPGRHPISIPPAQSSLV